MRRFWVITVPPHKFNSTLPRTENTRSTGLKRLPLALIRKLALNILRQEPAAQGGIAAKQKRAGWDQAYLLKILSLT